MDNAVVQAFHLHFNHVARPSRELHMWCRNHKDWPVDVKPKVVGNHETTSHCVGVLN